jgi:RNA-binding protein 39
MRAWELREFFERGAGKVVDVSIVRDRSTNRPKGLAYVEFWSKSSVPKAVKLTGTMVRGVPILVQVEESTRRLPGDGVPVAVGPYARKPAEPKTTVYIGGLGDGVNEEDVCHSLEEFGELLEVHMNDRYATVR